LDDASKPPIRDEYFLATAENRLGVVVHPVHGTLKHLPNNHKIWLIVMDEKARKIWPQGLGPVEYDKEQGTWKAMTNTSTGYGEASVGVRSIEEAAGNLSFLSKCCKKSSASVTTLYRREISNYGKPRRPLRGSC
jgi:hypothetical protein